MAEFTPVEAALEGFRVGRENPRGVAIWTATYFAAAIVSAVITVQTGAGAAALHLMELTGAPAPDPNAVAAASIEVLPKFLIMFLPFVAARLLIQPAVLRLALRAPSEGRPYLALGADELRYFACLVITSALTLLGTLIVSVVFGLLTPVAPAIFAPLGLVAMLAVAVGVAVRLCFLAPIAIAERRISVADAWTLSQGKSRGIFATLLLAFVFLIVVVVLTAVVAGVIRTVAVGDPQAVLTSMPAIFAPGQLAAMLVESLTGSLGAVMTTAPAAALYRALRPAKSRAEVF